MSFPDPFVLAGREYRSRLIIGSGKYASFDQNRRAAEAAGAEIVTVAVRRVNITDPAKESLLEHLPLDRYTILRRHRGRPRRLNDARKPEAGLPGAGAMCLLCDRCAPLANSVPIGTGTVFSFWELCIIALTGKLRVPKYEQQPGCRNWSGRRRYLER